MKYTMAEQEREAFIRGLIEKRKRVCFAVDTFSAFCCLALQDGGNIEEYRKYAMIQMGSRTWIATSPDGLHYDIVLCS